MRRDALTAAIVLFLCASNAAPDDFYVATNGNDGWSGTLAAPNAARTDGPFATVHRAQQAARGIGGGQREGPVTVQVRGGMYFLDAPLVFTPEDSGSPEAPTVYANYPGERPVLSGGRRLGDWEVDAQGRWTTVLPDVARGEWAFSQLFVNGERRFRPRLPAEGYFYIAKELGPTEAVKAKGYDRFGFCPGDIRADWTNLQDVEVLCFHQWSMSRLRIGAVDDGSRAVTFTGPTCNRSYWAGLQRGHRFLVENVAEALGTPGQWYLDRGTGRLAYVPRDGEDHVSASVIAPRLGRLVELQGQADLGLPVENVELRGLTFSHTNWTVPPRGHSFPQAEANLGAALRATMARRCVVQSCSFSHLGEYAMEWGAGCTHNRVEDCDVYDLGAGGIKLGTAGYSRDEAMVAGHNIVRNNRFVQGGRMHPAAIGIWIGHSPHNRVEYNDVYDFYYTGISMGWQWSYAPSNAHHNTISHNHVYQIGQHVLSDMGGIYTLGPTPGTVVAFNRFHDIQSYSYGGWGIYFDQATSEILAENNVVYRTKTGGFHQHFGKDNVVRNNVFAFAKTGQVQRTRPEDHRSFTFECNIVLWDEGPLLHGRWDDEGFVMDHNVYWHRGGEEIRFGKHSLEEWLAKGQDTNSVLADPRFVDPDGVDFRLASDSPALSVGFKPFDMGDVGCRTTGGRPPIRDVPRAFPRPPDSVPELPVTEGFEDSTPGAKAPGAKTYEDEKMKEAVARVTDECAAEGRHSLKFVDARGQKNPWDPHVVFEPKFRTGTVVGRFSLRVEAGTPMYHEWRHYGGGGYETGPALHVSADGDLRAGTEHVAALPPGEWVSIEITCELGEEAGHTYDLALTLPDGEAIRREEVPFEPGFSRLDWFGFVATGPGAGVFYIDSVNIGKLEQ